MRDLITELCDVAGWRLNVTPSGASIDTGTNVHIATVSMPTPDPDGVRRHDPAVYDDATYRAFRLALAEVRDQ